MDTVTYKFTDDHDTRTVTLSCSEIIALLGPGATTVDGLEMARLWAARHFDTGVPEFYDLEDLEATWDETVALMDHHA